MERNVELNDDQQKAFNKLLNFIFPTKGVNTGIMCFTGRAGFGKTFTLNYLLSEEGNAHIEAKAKELGIPDYRPDIHIWALTNKAAALLRDSLHGNTEVSTVHSAMKLRVSRNSYNAQQTLIKTKNTYTHCRDMYSNSVIFIDESSMWDTELDEIFTEVFKHIPVKIVFCGDPDQLLGIDGTNYLNHFTKQYTTAELHTPVRNSTDIYKLAHKYREGIYGNKFPDSIDGSDELLYIDNEEDFINHYVEHFNKGINVKALAWKNNHVTQLNDTLAYLIQGTKEFVPNQAVITQAPLSRGNTQLCTNNEELVITSIGKTYEATVYVVDIPNLIQGTEITFQRSTGEKHTAFVPCDMQYYRRLVSKAENNKDFHALSKLDSMLQINLYYACTVHKSQGSTYQYVYINLSHLGMNNRRQEFARLMYVALSRAKTKIIFTGDLPSKYVGA